MEHNKALIRRQFEDLINNKDLTPIETDMASDPPRSPRHQCRLSRMRHSRRLASAHGKSAGSVEPPLDTLACLPRSRSGQRHEGLGAGGSEIMERGDLSAGRAVRVASDDAGAKRSALSSPQPLPTLANQLLITRYEPPDTSYADELTYHRWG